LIKNKKLLKKNVKNGIITAFWQKHGKTWHFGEITTLDKNNGLHDFRVSVIFYCPYSLAARDKVITY